MTAFVQTSFALRCSRRQKHSACRMRTRRAASRTVRAVISDESKTSADNARVAKHDLFNWIDAWYPIIPECDAPTDEPYAFTLFDSKYVLFHATAGWSVLDDRCSHRLAPLSEGRIVNTESGERELECAYHGWGFAGCGSCTRIPQLEDGAKIPRRANVRSYRAAVDAGVIWMYLGDAAAAPLRPTLPTAARELSEAAQRNADTFMRLVPYGYETLMENALDPEHVHWAHHGASPSMNRRNGGKDRQEAERVDGTHDMRLLSSGRFNIPGGFMPPCISYRDAQRPGARFVVMFLATPVTRSESRVFAVSMVDIDNPWLRAAMNIVPRWYRHATEQNNIIDGDNVFLRALQRELGDPTTWKSKFLPLEKTCDACIVQFRTWMDENRDAMPWRTEAHTIDPLTRDAMLERYHSHVVHCKSCSRAYKGVQLGVAVANAAMRVCFVSLICTLVILTLGTPMNTAVSNEARVRVGVSVLTVLLGLVTVMRNVLQDLEKQFVLTDKARRLLLSD